MADDTAALERQHTLELARARAQGVKDGEDAQAATETARELASMRVEITKMQTQLTAIKTEQDTRDAVNAALIAVAADKGAKKLAKWQQIALGLASVLGVGSFVVAVLQAVHG